MIKTLLVIVLAYSAINIIGCLYLLAYARRVLVQLYKMARLTTFIRGHVAVWPLSALMFVVDSLYLLPGSHPGAFPRAFASGMILTLQQLGYPEVSKFIAANAADNA